MKNFSIEDLKTLLKDVKNSEEKKTFYILLVVFVAVSAIAIGVAAILIKKHCDECGSDDIYDDWDTEDECDDENCDCGSDEE